MPITTCAKRISAVLLTVALLGILVPGRWCAAADGEIVAGALRAQVTWGINDAVIELENRSPREVSAAVALELPRDWSAQPKEQPCTLPPPVQGKGTRVPLRFMVNVPPKAPLDDYAVQVVMTVPAGKIRPEPVVLRLTTPLGDFSDIRLVEVYSSAPSLAVPVRNPFGKPIEALVGLQAADWSITPARLPASLAPGEEKLLRFVVAGRLPIVGPLKVAVGITQKDGSLAVRRTVDISKQRMHGLNIGKPEVQALRFDGRTLTYTLRKMAATSVRIYDSQGRLIRTLDSGWQATGPHKYNWTPEREFDEFDNRIRYLAEVRAGLDVSFEKQIGAPPDTVFGARSVALGADGIVHVFEGPRAMKFHAHGEYVGCDLPGIEVDGVEGIRPLPNGTYVALWKGRLVLLDAAGGIVRPVADVPAKDAPAAPVRFRGPASLAVSRNGLIYASDVADHCVRRFDSRLEPSPFGSRETNILGKLDPDGSPAAGTANGEFTSPEHIAVGPYGRLAVLDATGRLQIFDATGRHLKTLATGWKDVACIAIELHAVFVAMRRDGKIAKYSTAAAALQPVRGFGKEGSAAVESTGVLSVEPGGGKLFVCGEGAPGVFILNADSGKVLGTLGRQAPPGAVERPAGIDVDAAGGIILSDLGTNRVVRLSQLGDVVWTAPAFRTPMLFFGPIDVTYGPKGNVYVLDETGYGKQLIMLDSRGRPRFGFGKSYVLESEELKQAIAVVPMDQGHVWVGDDLHGTVLDSEGNVLGRYAPRPPSKAQAGGMLYSPWQEGGARGIAISDINGRRIAHKGGPGTDDGKLAGCLPGGIAARAGAPGKPDYVYYADIFNHRITVLRVQWSSHAQMTGNWSAMAP
ncbi:MAG: hypothetical protein HQ592_12270 [Planctomycetes bacterium]|nr:hypothetical protein [Planctomycetota bacterium]